MRRPTAIRSSGRFDRTRSTRRSTTSSISISFATSRRSRALIAVPYVMVVNPSFPAKTVPEFIAYAKANPGKINMASAGNGTAPHVSGELFKMMTGVNMVHVPYRGSLRSPICSADRCRSCSVRMPVVDRVHQGRQAARPGGDHSDALGGAAGHPDRGRIRAGLRGERWQGIGAPKNTPAEIIDKLNKEINAGLADPKMKARLADLGGTVASGLARRLRQAHRRRNREVGQGGQVRGHQAGLIRETFHKCRQPIMAARRGQAIPI